MAALVKHLPTPGVEINKLFRLMCDDVMAATCRQEPFVYGTLPGEAFLFVAGQSCAPALPDGEEVAKNFISNRLSFTVHYYR